MITISDNKKHQVPKICGLYTLRSSYYCLCIEGLVTQLHVIFMIDKKHIQKYIRNILYTQLKKKHV